MTFPSAATFPDSDMLENALMSEKNAPDRPKKTATLNIRLPEGGKEIFQAEAARYGLTMSEFVRFLIFEEMRRYERGETLLTEALEKKRGKGQAEEVDE